MSITVYTYNDKVLKNAATHKWLKKYVDPYNPLGLPPLTIRVKLRAGSSAPSVGGATVTAVQGQADVYDICTAGGRGGGWGGLLVGNSAIEQVLGANSTDVTSMSNMFTSCASLTSIALFDTSSVSDMRHMFFECSSLTSVPLFNTSSVVYTDTMFKDCTNVESGALALYNQLSALGAQIESYEDCFKNCGSNTVTGAAELAQIPSSWGGTAS